MLKKFALNILNEVANTCEDNMNTPEMPEVLASVYDEVSKDLTDALYELSREVADTPS